MPIYAYRCSTCGHAKDALQKLSDPVLTLCPECGASTFVKQVTAAGFQLKGSGWYVTDFRNGDKPAAKPADGAEAAKGDAPKADSPASTPAAGATGDSGSSSGSGSGSGKSKGEAAPSPAAAPPPAPTAPKSDTQ